MIRKFHRPETVEEAVQLKERLGNRAIFLAGGTEVNSSSFAFPGDQVISLASLGLGGVRVTEAELVVGAFCTIAELTEAAGVPKCVQAAGLNVVNRNIRNVATVGGHLASSKSCGDLVPVLVVLEAVLDTASPGGTGTVPVLEYLGLESKPLVTRVRIPRADAGRQVAVGKYSRTFNDMSILTAAVALSRDGDCIRDPIVAAGGVARHVVRLEGVEGKLRDRDLPDREEVESWVADAVAPVSDVRGSAAFKRYRAGVLVATTVQRAYRGEGEGGR
ncbi:MAG TPA: FAD binding domain-containing protein [Phycisphaerae bacterium]|nr:FAD binding domain-containing protein [Phycisphaerae bacterium]